MAGKFQFRLEVVRKLRKQAQDVQRRVVAEAVRAVHETERRTADLTRQLDGVWQVSRSTQQEKSVNVSALRGQHFYAGWLHRKIIESEVDIGEAKSRLDQERQVLASKTKELKVIEKLRDKKQSRHISNEKRVERALEDEAAAQLYVRRNSRSALISRRGLSDG